MHQFLKFIFGMKLYMFRTVTSWSCSQAVSKPVWHIPLLWVQWKTPYDGQRNCPKHVEFHSKNKFEKSVHLVGFIIRKGYVAHIIIIIIIIVILCIYSTQNE
jgi:hypothetical protein